MNTQNYCYLRATRVVRLVHVVVEFYFHPTSCDRLWPNGHPAEIFLPFILGPLSVAPDMQAFEVRQLRCPALARIRNGALIGLFGITIQGGFEINEGQMVTVLKIYNSGPGARKK